MELSPRDGDEEYISDPQGINGTGSIYSPRRTANGVPYPNGHDHGSPHETQSPESHWDPVEPGFDPVQPPAEAPARPLNSRDVASFIINKMIGTGIFTNPPLVLWLTKNKGEALGLWIVGFLYTLLSMVIYLEFSRVLPHTGGELIYLDEMFYKPLLLAYTIYTFYFVGLYNTATNALQFGNLILKSANADNPSYDPDRRLLVFIAIVGLSFFCLLHYFSARAGRTWNQLMAAYKICLLVVVVIAGICKASKHAETDWSTKSASSSNSAAAFLLIVFSFTGWENATFVSGEIENHRILRNGFVAAVFIVGIFYILVNLVFLLAFPEHFITDNPDTYSNIPSYVPWFFGDSKHANIAWSILITVSAAGSLLSVIYTCSRVKQSIAMSNILPWSRLWKTSSPFKSEADGVNDNPTPQGGLILHWGLSVVLIFITLSIKDTSTAIGFPGTLQAYASGWIGLFIALGFTLLNRRYDVIPRVTQRHWDRIGTKRILQPAWLRPLASKIILSLLYLACNLYIIIALLVSNLPMGYVQGKWYVTTVICVIAAGVLYYFVTIYDENRSILKFAGVKPHIDVSEFHDPDYGYRKKVKVEILADRPSYLYWLFGGSQRSHWPRRRLLDIWDQLLGR